MPGFTHTLEGYGHVMSCPCGWLVWGKTEDRAAKPAAAHAKTCKHHTQEAQK